MKMRMIAVACSVALATLAGVGGAGAMVPGSGPGQAAPPDGYYHQAGGPYHGWSGYGGGYGGGYPYRHYRGHYSYGPSVGIYVGPGFIWGPPYWAYPAPWVMVQPPPSVYVEAPRQGTDYWYYCTKPAGYYPYVQNCPTAWLQVVPQQTPPGVAAQPPSR